MLTNVISEEKKVKNKEEARGKKKLVVVALEKLPYAGIGRAYAQIITDASNVSFRPFFEEHISKDANVVTDAWPGYTPIKKDYPNLKQIPSNNGKNCLSLSVKLFLKTL